jgi:NADH dehydrogenase
MKKHIVILGAGFAGIYAYRSIMKEFGDSVDITIVNRNNYFCFTPLLHEVATGGLTHHAAVESIREIIHGHGTELIVDEIVAINTKLKKVKLKNSIISYDYLVIATGATTSYFGVAGAKENTLPLKDLRDAINIRNHLIDRMEKGAEEENIEKKNKLLHIVIVGGGPTGVEVAGEVADFFYGTCVAYYKDKVVCGDVNVTLISSSPTLIPMFTTELQAEALDVLKKKGIDVKLNTKVKEIKKGEVVMEDGSSIVSDTIIWNAGVVPNTPKFSTSGIVEPGHRLPVDKSLRVVGAENVFALGDVASFVGGDKKPLPMLAQVATRQGDMIAKIIWAIERGSRVPSFTYTSRGELVSLGRYEAVADVMGVQFSGGFAWFVWRTIYLFKFVSISKQIKIAVDWTLNLFFPRDITKA